MAKINVVHDVDGEDYEVWLDTGVAAEDGICIGAGATEDVALRDARCTLALLLKMLAKARREPGGHE